MINLQEILRQQKTKGRAIAWSSSYKQVDRYWPSITSVHRQKMTVIIHALEMIGNLRERKGIGGVIFLPRSRDARG
ncbi:uncharacterized protein PHALS_06524 [Plasmopara halstedii]|uniref:Uncharacterized protein n=1 Tax=Plasmopara halstedii TaxID=4781 RepID=A0A0P1B2N1_PLAHL|nr:uncharacterized protein PHALS_06524 [Plasmopara halstedii]CEG48711.1 hypothetical protein PHALS_06524 [Plasmopara halstedii]|eukprot:XP_024585080.1 hypothetical protein PHALS_06524 [Plasmopara halstedii]